MQNPAPTTRRSRYACAAIVSAAATALLALPQSASANTLWPDGGVSPIVSKVTLLFAVVFGIGLIAVIAITLSILGAARNEVDVDSPEVAADTSAKGALIAGGLIFVVLAVLGIFVSTKTSGAQESLSGTGAFKATSFSEPNVKTPHDIKPPKGGAYEVHVNAQQYLWRYTYPGIKGKWDTYSYHDLVIPAGVTTLLDVTSSDVEAGWWVPQLGGSVTALPGYNNKTWIRADKPGLYQGAGTVVNGTNYASMSTTVIALPPRLFVRWVAGKQIEIAEAMAALGVERLSGEEEELITGESLKTQAEGAVEDKATESAIEAEGE